jgi:folate-binding protein YgfZ
MRDPTAASFGDLAGEVAALFGEVALVDLGERGLLSIAGDDRTKWLHGLCTQDIAGLGPLEGAYACHIDIKGRIIADFRVVNLGDFLLLDTEPGMARPLRRALKRYVVMEKIQARERMAEVGQLGLVGPGAIEVLAKLTGDRDALAGLKVHGAAPVEFGGAEVLAIRTDQFGVDGLRLVGPHAELASLWGALAAHARPVGTRALELVRIWHGRPIFGADLGPDVLFNEACLGDAVSFTKGCYLGQEVVERVDSRDRAPRKLVALDFDATIPSETRPTGPLRLDGQEVGLLTSYGALPAAGYARGLALVRRGAWGAGQRLEAALEDSSVGGACVRDRNPA